MIKMVGFIRFDEAAHENVTNDTGTTFFVTVGIDE
jgi:hypothetical protein